MTLPAFDPRVPSTWGLQLSAKQVASILGRSYSWLRHQALRGQCQPAPRFYEHGRPRWHRDDVARYVDQGPAVVRQRRSA